MTQPDTSKENKAGREIVLTRLLNAPRDLVFQVWTEPEHILQWWGAARIFQHQP